MAFTVEQKSQLAKLMATENLTIQHQKIRTAYFDPKNRVLYLPIWQNMDGDMYDLLGGHEVGHALYTPPEGWHDVATDKSRPKAFKNFLNVVEDARIEKKVQRKYPGLKSSFRRAYKQLMDRDFFGIKDRAVNEMAFIDRLNIFTKSQYTAYITFNDDEQKMLEKVKDCETWEDVLRVTDEIFEYSKDEQYEMQMQDFEYSDAGESGDYLDDYDDSDTFDQEQPEYDDDPVDSDKSADGEKSENQDKERSSDDSQSDSEDDHECEESTENGSINRDKESTSSEKDQFMPRCGTDENYREREDSLLDEKCKNYVYVNIPKMISSEIFVSAKRVQEQLSDYYDNAIKNNDYSGSAVKEVSEFKRVNERYVGLLAKEFEMRKAAKAFSKSKLSETGDIDVSRLAGYKFDDNIFRKVVSVPKGKSHGLILLLDCSGSMSNNMSGSIEQIIVLAMFCRKVNIPFHVFGFSDSEEAHEFDTGKKHVKCFSTELHDMNLGTVYLREYLNSNMKNSEYSKALRNMILLKKSYEGGYRRGAYLGRPESEQLSNTPLTQAIVALGQMMPDFKRKNNIDLTSLVIVHDGDSDGLSHYYENMKTFDHSLGDYVEKVMLKSYNYYAENIVITDKKNKFQKMLSPKGSQLTVILDWFKQATGSKVFGFFLVPMNNSNIRSALNNRYYFEDGKNFYEKYVEAKKINPNDNSVYELQREYGRKLRSEKFLLSKAPGYNEFFLIAGGSDLRIEDEELEVEGKVTSSKLKNAFMKMNKKKQVNRVLVSTFIQGIAV